MYAISRIDHHGSRTHSWHVTLQRRNKIYTRHFSDGRYGGKGAALKAAKAYRDQLYWDAQWPTLSSKPIHRKFSIKTYGERRAFQLAVHARRHGLRQLKRLPFRSKVSVRA